MTDKYKLLTVAEVRKKYWDKKKKEGKLIKFHDAQDFKTRFKNMKNISEKGMSSFIPDGSIDKAEIHGEGYGMKLKRRVAIPNWLSTHKSGPYKRKCGGKNCVRCKSAYFINGQIKFSYDKKFHQWGLQICSDPVNVVSTDCLDNCLCYVKK